MGLVDEDDSTAAIFNITGVRVGPKARGKSQKSVAIGEHEEVGIEHGGPEGKSLTRQASNKLPQSAKKGGGNQKLGR